MCRHKSSPDSPYLPKLKNCVTYNNYSYGNLIQVRFQVLTVASMK
jgi:hypothetical protein